LRGCHLLKLAGEATGNARRICLRCMYGKTKEGGRSRTLPLYRLRCRETQTPAFAEALSFAPADTLAALVAGT
jgi:hypothetical protein